jgi:heme-degrading monooxygenase HmoA
MMTDLFEPPYVAVIFSSQRTEGERGYGAVAQRMVDLASRQPGFLGVESARDGNGFGITVSYWKDEASVAAWKANLEHAAAQKAGKEAWYAAFRLRVATVSRNHGTD